MMTMMMIMMKKKKLQLQYSSFIRSSFAVLEEKSVKVVDDYEIRLMSHKICKRYKNLFERCNFECNAV
jgi:hypothetical protein